MPTREAVSNQLAERMKDFFKMPLSKLAQNTPEQPPTAEHAPLTNAH
jgi:hypothetical protein